MSPVRDFVASFDADFTAVAQEVYYAIDVTLSAVHFRISNADFPIVIGGNTYTAYYSGLKVPNLSNAESLNEIEIRVANKVDSATSLGRYDFSEDLAGSAITVWQVRFWNDAGARKQIQDEVWIGYILNVGTGSDKWVELVCVQELGLGSRPANRTCWQKCGYLLSDARCEYAGIHTSCDYTLESCAGKIFTTDESGGLTTTTMSGTYTGGDVYYYVFKIVDDDPANPNTFAWLKQTSAPVALPGAGWSAALNCTVAAQLIENGLSIAFDAVTGNGATDSWCWVKCSNIDRYGGFVMIPKPGTQIVFGGQVSTVAGHGGSSPVSGHNWSDPGGHQPGTLHYALGHGTQHGASTGEEPTGWIPEHGTTGGGGTGTGSGG